MLIKIYLPQDHTQLCPALACSGHSRIDCKLQWVICTSGSSRAPLKQVKATYILLFSVEAVHLLMYGSRLNSAPPDSVTWTLQRLGSSPPAVGNN